MPAPTMTGLRAEYGDALRRFPRGDGEEVRIAVNKVNGVAYVDIRHWQADGWGRFRPTDRHVTLRRNELPFAIEALRQASPIVGAVPVTRPPSPSEGRARRQLDMVRAALTSIKQAVREAIRTGDASMADESLDDLVITLMDTAE